MVRSFDESVAVVKGDDPRAMTERALSLISAKDVVSPKDRVLIKPNYITNVPASTGIITDSRVVDAIIEFIKRCGVTDITVGDGGGGDTDETFNTVGVREVTRHHGVKLVDFNDDEKVKVDFPEGRTLRKVDVAKTVLDSTCIINVPCLKAHELGLVTLSFKNLDGTISPRHIIHRRLNENLVDLAAFLKPKLVVVSGIVGHEGHQTFGDPVPMNLIIAGRNMVATDAVAAAIMEVEPMRVRVLWLAQQRGLGPADLDHVEVLGEPIEAVKKRFKLGYTPSYPPSLISLLRWGVGNWDYHVLSTAGVIDEKAEDLDI